jgi:hypothetical protein
MAQEKGGEGDRVAYLTKIALNHSTAFVSLLGKVLPTQVAAGDEGGAIQVTWLPPSN